LGCKEVLLQLHARLPGRGVGMLRPFSSSCSGKGSRLCLLEHQSLLGIATPRWG